MKNTTGKYLVQVGKGKSKYETRYSLDTFNEAHFWYTAINVFRGYKKRLVNPDGRVVIRKITF